MTIPNRVTLGGMVAVALYVAGYLSSCTLLLLASFTAAVASDFLDGFLARRLHQKSQLGAILDPVRDRILLLAFLGNLFVWDLVGSPEAFLIAVLVGCEASVWVVRILYTRATHGGHVKTNGMGKLRQAVHVTFMGAFFAERFVPAFGVSPRPTFVYLAGMAVVSLIAFGAYLTDARGARRRFRTIQHIVPR